jgi:3-(3-hydroxy-phenyl)propionate hydroxylase
MQQTCRYPEYPYRRSDEQASGQPQRHPVVVVGAGPVGLTTALDLARRGVPVVVIDDNNTVSVGSRAICFAKRPLEILDRLGCAAPIVAKGVNWKVGKVFFRDEPVFSFDLLPEAGHKLPAMINLQQYYVEQFLVEACQAEPRIELRWKHRLVGLRQHEDFVELNVETPDGNFTMQASWLIACDGAGSPTRTMVGAQFEGQVFQDRFLIADVIMKAGFPPERWFWFDPPFHPGQSVLLHKQADGVWRIDFQLGPDADPVEEKKPENVIPRIRAMLGPEAEFELEWVSIYQFACRRIDRFRHGRVLFAGDSAHQVSPFGARGANSGLQDADNLAWKLALVLAGQAPEALLDTYHDERSVAADDNLLNSTRATDFISPKNAASLVYRNAVLDLARTEPFARALVNSGRLSTPTPYVDSSLNTPDTDAFDGAMRPGTNCADAPLERNGERCWLLDELGDGFVVLCFGAAPAFEAASLAVGELVPRLSVIAPGCEPGIPGARLIDRDGLFATRYDARPGTTYLVRPDQHVAGRWRSFAPEHIRRALERALGLPAA